jgi:hypothetical protein
VGEGDYEIIPSSELLSKWDHAPRGEDLDILKRVLGQEYPVGVVVDIRISRLHRGKGYGKQILDETIRHMISEEGVQSVLLIVETHPEEPFDLVEWYTREGFKDMGITTRYQYPLMVLKRAIELGYKESEVLGQRENPSQEWFETQSLQNDEDGYLINPDTGGTLWYHGSRYGGLFSGGRVIYFSSDMDIARTMACQLFTYAEDEGTTVIHKAKIKVRTDEIFDARYAESTDAARYLADRLELEGPYTTDTLDFDNFDEKIGYLAPEYADTSSYAQALGFKGWLEVESTYGDPEPCTIGLFTNNSIDYEIIETHTLSMGDCEGFY